LDLLLLIVLQDFKKEDIIHWWRVEDPRRIIASFIA
jgi:hypothetical protein